METAHQDEIERQSWVGGKIPPQAGRLAVVTGGTRGLGLETALMLAQGCVDVIIAGRSEDSGREALTRIRPLAPAALVRFERLDLGNLSSVAEFAGRLTEAGRPVDLLINNAGIIAPPKRQVTSDGFEAQMGINYLGHFALTGILLPLLRRSRGPRIVQVSSLLHRFGSIRFDDLHCERIYGPWAAYAQSKLAALVFARELQRRSDSRGWGLLSTCAHPGYAQTALPQAGPGTNSLPYRLNRLLERKVRLSSADGARPILFAATSTAARPGGFYGPGGLLELAGPPAAAFVAKQARDREVARLLWEASENLTGVRWLEAIETAGSRAKAGRKSLS